MPRPLGFITEGLFLRAHFPRPCLSYFSTQQLANHPLCTDSPIDRRSCTGHRREWAFLLWIARCLMRLCCALVLLLALMLPAAAQPPADPAALPLTVNRPVPATFHPFNLNVREGGNTLAVDPDYKPLPGDVKRTTKGKFHCLITEYNRDPVVMMFARDVEKSEGFRDLLKKLDAAGRDNPAGRLRCFVVFLVPGLDKVMEDDGKRDDARLKLEPLADDLGLKLVVLTIAGAKDVEKYKLDDNLALTVGMYRDLRFTAIHKVKREDLDAKDSPAIAAILADAAKLTPKR